VEPLIWCDFIDSKATHYQQVQEPEKLVEILTGHLQDYNSMAKRGMDLVLFMAAAQHVSQIVRVLKTPLGNCLLVGIGGSGVRGWSCPKIVMETSSPALSVALGVMAVVLSLTGFGVYQAFGPPSKELDDPFDDHED
jgi:PsbN protein